MMLDKDGQFLGNILNIALKRFWPASFCYDLKTHRVWVGSVTNIVIVNKYINRQDIQTVQGQQRKCVAPPNRYVLDRSNPTAFADEFNIIFP